MFEIAGEVYYFDLERLSDFVRFEVKPADPVEDVLGGGVTEEETIDNEDYNDSIWGNLEELLFVIQTVHTKTNVKSGFTAPFDFRKIINTLSYSEDGNKSISGQKLTTFIKEYLTFLFDNSINESSNSLLDYFKTRYNLDNKQINKLSKLITQNWEEIEQSIKVECYKY